MSEDINNSKKNHGEPQKLINIPSYEQMRVKIERAKKSENEARKIEAKFRDIAYSNLTAYTFACLNDKPDVKREVLIRQLEVLEDRDRALAGLVAEYGLECGKEYHHIDLENAYAAGTLARDKLMEMLFRTEEKEYGN